jgi:hypothetical protein
MIWLAGAIPIEAQSRFKMLATDHDEEGGLEHEQVELERDGSQPKSP